MKYFQLYEQFNNSYYGKTLWRGVDHGTLYAIKNDRNVDIGRYFSEKREFAEDYGEHIFEIKLLTNNVFNSLDPDNIRKLYSEGFTFTDESIRSGDEDTYPTFDFENDIFPTADSFLQAEHSKTNTWEVIEQSKGVLGWIMSNYDVCLIAEDGVINYYIEDSKHYEIVQLHEESDDDGENYY